MNTEELRALGRKVKLIVCDLDGTLLNSGKQISDANLRAIEKAGREGVFTTLCSGRIHQMMQVYIRRLNIRGPLIAANGAVIFDGGINKILSQKTLDPDEALPLLQFCRQNGMDYSALTAGGSFFSKNSVRIGRFKQYNTIAQSEGLATIPLRFFENGRSAALPDDIYKILIYELKEGQQKTAEERLKKIPAFNYTSSEKGLLDVSARGVNKGRALRELARILGVTRQQICVFGDYYNDITMMAGAGLSIAMGNAPDEVKKATLAVTGSNDEDGVALGIEKYILQTEGK